MGSNEVKCETAVINLLGRENLAGNRTFRFQGITLVMAYNTEKNHKLKIFRFLIFEVTFDLLILIQFELKMNLNRT